MLEDTKPSEVARVAAAEALEEGGGPAVVRLLMRAKQRSDFSEKIKDACDEALQRLHDTT